MTENEAARELGSEYLRLTAARFDVLARLRPHIVRMYQAEVPAAEIAARTGLTRGGVYSVLTSAGIPRVRGARNAATARAAQAARGRA